MHLKQLIITFFLEIFTIQSQQYKHLKKVLNIIKDNKRDTRVTWMMYTFPVLPLLILCMCLFTWFATLRCLIYSNENIILHIIKTKIIIIKEQKFNALQQNGIVIITILLCIENQLTGFYTSGTLIGNGSNLLASDLRFDSSVYIFI